jgi:U3 small nucleolar RNA-associated protein 14
MGGRQAHGRSITARPLGKGAKKGSSSNNNSNSKKGNKEHRARALDAYTLAAAGLPDDTKTPRHRNPDIDAPPKKRQAAEPSEDELDALDLGGPQRKKPRPTRREKKEEESDVEYGSDGEGNQWRVGAPAGEDDDSEIDSDEAFGESDHDNFEGYAFRGSKPKAEEVCLLDDTSGQGHV